MARQNKGSAKEEVEVLEPLSRKRNVRHTKKPKKAQPQEEKTKGHNLVGTTRRKERGPNDGEENRKKTSREARLLFGKARNQAE